MHRGGYVCAHKLPSPRAICNVVEHKGSDRSGWRAAVGAAIAGALVGVVGTLATGILNYWSHQNDLDTQMITLSVDVLRAKPTDTTIPLREWAIESIEKRANFNFTNDQKEALIKQALPAPLYGSAAGMPDGTPCGPFVNNGKQSMVVMDGMCVFP